MSTVRRKDRRGNYHRIGIDVVVDGERHVVVNRPRLRRPKKRQVVVMDEYPYETRFAPPRLPWWRRLARWLRRKA